MLLVELEGEGWRDVASAAWLTFPGMWMISTATVVYVASVGTVESW